MAAAYGADVTYYKMDASPKGICLIINNFEFERSPNLDTGPADKENLTRTFRELDFELRYFENLTCTEMKRQMEDIQNTDHSQFNCFVCCISSHGSTKGVCGADDYTVNVSELQSYVYSTQCASLAGKPKVFLIDACRGRERPRGIHLSKSAAPTRQIISDKRDFLVSFATTANNTAWTSGDSSVYFYHLSRLLTSHAKSKTVIQILHMLNEALTAACEEHALQTAEFTSTLAKELRFHDPGSCLRVLLVGKSGVGKSSLGNALANLHDSQQRFKVGRGLKSETFYCEWRKTTWEGLTIEVIDTPGLCNTHPPESWSLRELSRGIALCHPGPHVIIFTARCDRRFTKVEINAYQTIKEMFGAAMTKHLIVVFNGLDTYMDDKDVHVEEAREKLSKALHHFSEVRTIVHEANGRFFGMNNNASPAVRTQQARDLIKMMQGLVTKNGYSWYLFPGKDQISRKVNDMIEDYSRKKKMTHSEAEDAVKTDISERNVDLESLTTP